MNIFQEASKRKLRFPTKVGLISTEQLWDISTPSLAILIKESKVKLKKEDGDDELSFLRENKKVNKEEQLRFDILKEVYLIKKSEEDAVKVAASNKEHNEKILTLIKNKQDESLSRKSEGELFALLK